MPYKALCLILNLDGDEGLYALSERYILEHPEERENVKWLKHNVALVKNAGVMRRSNLLVTQSGVKTA